MKSSELHTKSESELSALIVEKRQELSDKQRSLKSGELANTNSIANIRRQIAAMLTIMSQRKSTAQEEEEAPTNV